MNFQISSRAPVRLEPIAIADIVINLFVFFFLSFGLFASFEGSLPIHLPVGGEARESTQAEPLQVILTRHARLMVGGKQVAFSELTMFVNRELENRENRTVVLAPSREVTLESFIPVLDSLRKSRAQSVSIQTELTGHIT